MWLLRASEKKSAQKDTFWFWGSRAAWPNLWRHHPQETTDTRRKSISPLQKPATHRQHPHIEIREKGNTYTSKCNSVWHLKIVSQVSELSLFTNSWLVSFKCMGDMFLLGIFNKIHWRHHTLKLSKHVKWFWPSFPKNFMWHNYVTLLPIKPNEKQKP